MAAATTTTKETWDNEAPAERKQFVASNAIQSNVNVPSWQSCYYCTRENFKNIGEFVA